MKTKELLEAVNNNGRNATLIFVGTSLPTIELSPEGGALMSINLNVFASHLSQLKTDEAFVIGREHGSNFRLPDNRLFSRLHCAITLVNGNFYIYDCSLNGTAVK